MRTFISVGLFSVFVFVASGLSSIAANTPPSDAVIRRQIVGTWFANVHDGQSTITIGTNGDFVEYIVSHDQTSRHSRTNRFEGTIEVRDGLMIYTFKKTSNFTNQPVRLMFTNVMIRVTDHELVSREQDGSHYVILKRVTQ